MRLLKRFLIFLMLLFSLNAAAVSMHDEKRELKSGTDQDAQRLLVKKFYVKGFKPYPEKNITLYNLNNILRQALQYHKNKLTFDDIYTVADYLTAAYSDAGLSFHQVIVPPQEVVNNTVTLEVIEGVLGDISAFPDDSIDQAFLAGAYAPYYQKSIDQENIEEATLLLNETPGLEVFSYYSRGIERGESRLNVRVQESEAWQGYLRLDNYGNDSTGVYRLLGTFQWNRPFMSADELSISVMQSANPGNNTYGTLAYRAPLIGYRTFLGFLISNNEFKLGGDFTGLEASGSSSIMQLDLFYKQSRSSSFNQDFSFYVNKKSSNLVNKVTNILLAENLETQGLGITWALNAISHRKTIRNNFFLNTYGGEYSNGFSDLDGERFFKSYLSYELNWQVISPASMLYSDLRFKLAGQVTGDSLPSYEKALLTGPYAVRAYDNSQATSDEAAVISIDWTLLNSQWMGNNMFSRYTKPYLFYDVAFGKRNNPSADLATEVVLDGYGLGLFYQLHRKLTGNISIAKANTFKLDGVDQGFRDTRVFFDMVYQF